MKKFPFHRRDIFLVLGPWKFMRYPFFTPCVESWTHVSKMHHHQAMIFFFVGPWYSLSQFKKDNLWVWPFYSHFWAFFAYCIYIFHKRSFWGAKCVKRSIRSKATRQNTDFPFSSFFQFWKKHKTASLVMTSLLGAPPPSLLIFQVFGWTTPPLFLKVNFVTERAFFVCF